MATSITITITPTRALTVEGRLVAGETAEVTIGGATPTALYLVAPDHTVIAACEAFTPTGQGSGGTGFLQLATEQVAALFANTPAGRMVAVWALVNDADGVAGAGWIPVVSAPMPDELVDLDIDFYLRASQVGAGLAIVDGKLVCTVNPATYLTKTEAAQTYAPLSALAGKFNIETDSATSSFKAIEENGRQGFYARGAAYLLPDGEGAAAGGTLARLADLPAVPVQSVNGETGTVVLTASDVGAASAADLRYTIDAEPRSPNAQTGAYVLDDRNVNRITTSATSISLTVPAAVTGRARDFFVRILSTASGTGNVTLTIAGITIATPDGNLPEIPLQKDTILYFTEISPSGTFLLKGENLEVVL